MQTIQYQLTAQELAGVFLRHRAPGHFLFWWRVGSAGLGLGTIVGCRWASSPVFAAVLASLGGVLLLLAGGLLLAAPWRRRRAYDREVRRHPVFTEPKELSFGREGLAFASQHSSGKTAWAAFSHLAREDGLICLYETGLTLPSVIIPERAFDEATKQEFQRCSETALASPPSAPFFQEADLARLIRCEPVGGPLPFDPADDGSILRFYEPLVLAIEREHGLRSRGEWNHFGSGYASFIEVWFYPADGRTRLRAFNVGDERHAGLVVLLSRLSCYFALAEGEKSWSTNGGSGSLPNFEGVDSITHPKLLPFVAPVTSTLTAAGLRRLSRGELAAFLPAEVSVPTILSDPPFRQFDALFYWED